MVTEGAATANRRMSRSTYCGTQRDRPLPGRVAEGQNSTCGCSREFTRKRPRGYHRTRAENHLPSADRCSPPAYGVATAAAVSGRIQGISVAAMGE